MSGSISISAMWQPLGNDSGVSVYPAVKMRRYQPENPQLAFVGNKAEDGIERGCFARAVGADEADDAAVFYAKVDSGERNGCAEGLTETASFDAWHRFGDPPYVLRRLASGSAAGRAPAVRRPLEESSSSSAVRPSR